MPTIFGARLRELREKCNLTLSEFAELCSISTTYLGDLERGSRKLSPEKCMLFRREVMKLEPSGEAWKRLMQGRCMDQGYIEIHCPSWADSMLPGKPAEDFLAELACGIEGSTPEMLVLAVKALDGRRSTRALAFDLEDKIMAGKP